MAAASTLAASTLAIAPAFGDPPRESQAAFRVIMDAMARPGLVRSLAVSFAAPAPLSATAALVALTLCDFETSLWLDPALASDDVVAWLRFHSGARLTADMAAADFAIIADGASIPDFTLFAQGEPDYPDRSTTLIVQIESFSGAPIAIEGPGVQGRGAFSASPIPADFGARLKAQRAAFPLGVDFIFVSDREIAALPRSVRVMEG